MEEELQFSDSSFLEVTTDRIQQDDEMQDNIVMSSLKTGPRHIK